MPQLISLSNIYKRINKFSLHSSSWFSEFI